MAEMTLLRLLALRLGQELARRPEARAKAKEVLVKTQRLVNEELKPRAQQAWREAQPEIETAKRAVSTTLRQPDSAFTVATPCWRRA